MRAPLWQPAEALSSIERTAMRRIRRAKLFVFLRLHRHTLREDMYNLMGHALRKAVGMVVRQKEWELAEEAAVAGAPLLGAASPTAALDCDWDAPAARAAAQETVAMAQQVVQQLELSIFCKAWPLQQRAHCAKTAFALDWGRGISRCPHQVDMPFLPGATVHWSMYPNRPTFGANSDRCSSSMCHNARSLSNRVRRRGGRLIPRPPQAGGPLRVCLWEDQR